LDEIVHAKRQELTEAKRRRPPGDVKAAARDVAPARDFHGALLTEPKHALHVIAEIKKRSPSAGLIRPDFDPVAIANTYHEHGASCLSVLTDMAYFEGRLDYIELVRHAVPLPVLRKDFMIEHYQIDESRAAGADCVLLIGEVLDPSLLRELLEHSCELGMTTLIEVHEAATLEAVMSKVDFPNDYRSLLGINNRNLKIQKTDLSATETLARQVGAGTILVSESGVKTREDVGRLAAAGAHALLIGETFMRAPDIGQKMDELLTAV
jgi:indole-3-glycerol phosphate synthase